MPAISRLLTFEEYLTFEEQSPIKHEYIAGEVFAMSGVTTRHNLITLNIARALHNPARRRGCRTFAADVKLLAAAKRIYYPDVMIACGNAADADLIVESPSIVVEVTSPATRGTDRREKLDAYKSIASLRMYLIVEQRHRQVVAYSRDDGGEWVREEFNGTGDVALRPLQYTITLDDIYDDVRMPALTVGEDDEWEDMQAGAYLPG